MSDQLPAGVTQADVDALERAYVNAAINPTQQVRFADGASYTYRSLDEIGTALRNARSMVNLGRTRGGIFGRTTFARFCRG